LIHNSYEFWRYKDNLEGETIWRCCKHQTFHCKAKLVTDATGVVGNATPEHTHNGNVATALARKAVHDMKKKMEETVATPSTSQGAVVVNLPDHVLMALPKRPTLNRILRRHRRKALTAGPTSNVLPPLPTGLDFVFPQRFSASLLFDSGPGEDRLIILGDLMLLEGLSRSRLWLADGTFKVVPALYFQLYTVHFEFVGGCNPPAVYCLMTSKTRAAYDRIVAEVKRLVPLADPEVIQTDFEKAAMQAFAQGFPHASISGCYFHLTQSVVRKVSEMGLKQAYDSDDELRGFIRCLAALAFVPTDAVVDAFEVLVETMPEHDRINELVTYFENTYIRGRRLRGRVENYSPASFPITLWNKRESAIAGIARTTNIVEGWHHGLQSLFMCSHPTLWKFLEGIETDIAKQKAWFLQASTGVALPPRRKYQELGVRVTRAVAAYDQNHVLTYLRAIAHLSHS
jgi:hypothetical protein